MTLHKPIDSITEEDLQALISEPVAEGKTIDYKQALPDNTSGSKREFLADVTSFANAVGGHLVFGMKESGGIPTELCGLDVANNEAECLRLENLIRDNIEPRLPGSFIHAIQLESSKTAIVVFIPRSWTSPHVVNYEKHWRFYSRNSSGKYPLDVSEVRTAVMFSETLAQRTTMFRTERLSKIVAGETPVEVDGTARVILHLLPLGSFEQTASYDISSIANNPPSLPPLLARSFHSRHNFDGFVTYASSDEGNLYRSYLQLFRNGSIEAVDMYFVRERAEGVRQIHIKAMENELIGKVAVYLNIQKNLGVPLPVFLMLSLVGVKGYTLSFSQERFIDPEYWPIEKSDLIIPELMIEDYECDVSQIVRPAFDAIWNASGWPRSMNYDEEGRRIER
jgi:hypothetical protein